MHVFVYGTLKKGEPNHHWLTNESKGSAKFVSKGITTQKYPLIIASKYNVPFLLDLKGTGKEIHGEIYEVDDNMLNYLDILEDYPKLYTRRVEEIKLFDNDGKLSETTIGSWVYFLPQFSETLLKLPFLESYSSSGPHNLTYSSRYDDLHEREDIYLD